MSDVPFDFKEFIEPKKEPAEPVAFPEESNLPEEEPAIEELDVQKAVVEELAAEKVELHEQIAGKEALLQEKQNLISKKDEKIASLEDEFKAKTAELEALKEKVEKLSAENVRLNGLVQENIMKSLDMQERNPNALALLDREVELPDRFPGETRDHVLEVIKEARDKAEAEGRIRRAQLLEGVLNANEPSGNLAQRREALKKFIAENGNIINGVVMAELDRCKIAYKKGDEYLLPKEILLRTY